MFKIISRFLIAFIISFQFVFSGLVSADSFQAIPIYQDPNQPSTSSQDTYNQGYGQGYGQWQMPGQENQGQMPGQDLRGQTPGQRMNPMQRSRPQPQQYDNRQQQNIQQRPAETKSEFEQYISGQIQINDIQFDILMKINGIRFVNQLYGLPPDKISVPVKIVQFQYRSTETAPTAPDKLLIDAGFLIGSPDILLEAFKMLGIKSSLFVSTDIRQFGYDLFSRSLSSGTAGLTSSSGTAGPSPSAFGPSDKVPVSPDYVIGPGDEIIISVWGGIERQWDVVVEGDGTITLPKMGSIGVTGLTFRELKETLHKEASKYFKGFEMSVSMGTLKTIKVYIVGHASKPGSYAVSSFSTIVNALFDAGGPNKTGTMRDIQVKRNGKTIVHFDMYDFLLRGDKTNDLRLLPEDVIFIPAVGPLAAMAGSVNNPAIYELKGEKKISQLLEMAGGLSTVAFHGRVQIERIKDNTKQIVFEADIDMIKESDLDIQSGDVLKIFQIAQDKQVVRLSGAVQREGDYGFRPGMTVKDLLSMAGGLKYYAYKKAAELTRLNVTDQGPKTEKILINIEKAMSGEEENNIKLKENDYIFIRNVPEWRLFGKVSISGEVKFPGNYSAKKGEKLSSLIERAGGFTDSAYLRGAVFVRERVRELQQKGIDEMVKRLEREILAGGSVAASTATAEEAATKPLEMEQKRKFVQELRKLKATGRLSIKLAHLRLIKGSEYDIEIEDGDSLYIPTKNSVVNVIGAVMSNGSFIYSENLDWKDYIKMAGNYSRYADDSNVYVIKTDGTARMLSKGFISWNALKSRWEAPVFGEEVRTIEPGDTIVVPDQLDRLSWMREIKDITTILMNMAVVAGVAVHF